MHLPLAQFLASGLERRPGDGGDGQWTGPIGGVRSRAGDACGARGGSLLSTVSRREQIKMSDAEVAAFLKEERTVTCATVGRAVGRT